MEVCATMLAMRKSIFLCSLFALLCVAAGAQDVTPATAPVPATVHIYRYKQFTGSGLKPSVYCDGTELIRMRNGSVFSTTIAPGPHTFYANDKQAGAEFTLEPGREYFFRTDLQTGLWKGHFRLTMVMPQQGAFDIAKLKTIEAK
jgi:hypothetical protein